MKTKLRTYSDVNKKAIDQYINFTEQREQLLVRKDELDKGAEAIRELIEVLDYRKCVPMSPACPKPDRSMKARLVHSASRPSPPAVSRHRAACAYIPHQRLQCTPASRAASAYHFEYPFSTTRQVRGDRAHFQGCGEVLFGRVCGAGPRSARQRSLVGPARAFLFARQTMGERGSGISRIRYMSAVRQEARGRW